MSQIINWEYYSSHFPNVIPEERFEVIERQAEVEYRAVVKPYMNVPAVKERDCVFKLCNFIYANEDVLSGKSVVSASNNGYSESYGVQNINQAYEQMRELIYSSIGTRLAGAF